ncbi:hypothetical protein AWB80_04352 [Caballeronia pedi]|uniref:Uncharacterized protein n=1 Tax=Caballeronia pedi TaxID=1777141 RepID=A0A158BZ88_9BURK|nr:hypothetical protein [Caballeronia pedi]SAK75424.1 hypothetical protein AWB80_04352 [Caballeronia pedi]
METNREIDSAQKASIVFDALKAGKLKIRQEDEVWARELMALPRRITGLLDVSKLSPRTLAIVRAAALALSGLDLNSEESVVEKALSTLDAQCILFHHYEELFSALVGANSSAVASTEEIKSRVLDRIRLADHAVFDDFNAAVGELKLFYEQNAAAMFRAGKSLGGVKVVLGGQRKFGGSTLSATRIGGLYCDTQLIPDPVFPFLKGDLQLNALHLHLAIVLFHILPLRPLVDARLSVPPVLVFPSFEEDLERKDAITQAGMESMFLKVVAPACNASVASLEDLFDYATKHERAFLAAITNEKLFIPPGGTAETVGTADESLDIYLRDLKGLRDSKMLSRMEKMPRGALVLNAILERLRPQYHLAENADELDAQPMLSLPVHWYYFERCARAETRELVRQQVLSRDAFDILRALQDDSLTWLANVPIGGLVELRERMEHAELREQLKKFTTQLTATGPAELEAVLREVRHGLNVLIQRQKKAIKDVEDRYAPKYSSTAAGIAIGALAGASMFFMPTLAVAAGVTAPIATALGGVGGGSLAIAKDAVGQLVEKRRVRKSMLGMLATARNASK